MLLPSVPIAQGRLAGDKIDSRNDSVSSFRVDLTTKEDASLHLIDGKMLRSSNEARGKTTGEGYGFATIERNEHDEP